jgi:hypothetical protein
MQASKTGRVGPQETKKPAWQLAFAFHSTPPHFAESLFKPRPKIGERGFPFPADSNRW